MEGNVLYPVAEWGEVIVDPGYIKLDGVDRDRLALALDRWNDEDADYVTMVATKVLEAFDSTSE